ncbi:hypothetical protein FACS1894177_00890 [Bacteroidia bacterium]|nr:hypothetical protein FACS1894177_00890 [Bacteroidia bacterium]
MKTKYLILIMAFVTITSCNAQKINNNMEKYDFKTVNKSLICTGVVRNGWTILMYPMTDKGAYYNEYPPVPEFYKVVKTFYPNGNIKSMGKIAGEYLKFGQWVYYDEQGNFIEEIDEDSKLGKIKLINVLKFLEKEGHINLTTGEGREHGVIQLNRSAYIEHSRFYMNWIINDEKEYLAIVINRGPWNNNYETIYHVDKNTGDILFKESKQKFPIM